MKTITYQTYNSYKFQAMTAKGPWDRRFAFTAPFMVRMSMAFLRFIGKGGGNQLSFTHVILQVKSNLVGFDFKIRIFLREDVQ